MTDSTQTMAQTLLAGDRRALARAITLVESSRDDHRKAAWQLIEQVTPHAGESIRIGVSGSPGVGKSTFIEAFGEYLIEQGKRVAVLAVDPSSTISGGSILGDKTRMENLSRNPSAFIRPTPSSGALGGVAPRTREAMLLCEAAGFDVSLVETVGVGQSETTVSAMTDVFILLLLPAGGDELQGIKRGIVELADIILVNKADGDLEAAAQRTVSDYRQALRLPHVYGREWRVPVEPMSALTATGMDKVWGHVNRYHELLRKSGDFENKRAEQNKAWLYAEISDRLLERFRAHPDVNEKLMALEREVAIGQIHAPAAARALIDIFTGTYQQ